MTAQPWIALALLAAVAASGVTTVFSKHENRRLFAQLEELNRDRDELNAEWGMLQLEQGAWATHGRVERVAREQLDMTIPAGGDVIILRRR